MSVHVPILQVRPAERAEDFAAAKRLIQEYADWMDIDLAYQDFDEEMRRFPSDYTPPEGRLLIGLLDGQIAGVVALKEWSPEVCEMKRLWVAPAAKKSGLGIALVNEVIDRARQLGYRRMQLDTIKGQHDRAIALYRGLGFRPVPPYYKGAVPNTLFMALEL